VRTVSLSFGFKVVVGIFLMLGGIVTLGGYAVYSFRQVSADTGVLVAQSLRQVELAGDINTATTELLAAENSLLLNAAGGDAAHVGLAMRSATDCLERAKHALTAYGAMLDSAEDRRLHDDLTKELAEIERLHAMSEADLRANRHADADARLDGPLGAALARVRRNAAALTALATGDAQAIGTDTGAHSARATWVSLLLALACAAIAVGVSIRVRQASGTMHSVIDHLRAGSLHVVNAAGRVRDAAHVLHDGTASQASALQQTSASMEEMASLTSRNAQNSAGVAGLMDHMAGVVDNSNRALSEMTASMDRIADSSRSVSRIIKTIDEIAFQTNILALNAAVEAARAGDAGAGFAVVADEVRSLAQRSAEAARDTASLIERALAESDQGVQRVGVVATSISAITESVGRIRGLVRDVSEASQQQSTGIEQVAQAVVAMEKATQGNAASAESSAAASAELNDEAERTRVEVSRLSVLILGHDDTRVGGASRAAAALPVRHSDPHADDPAA